MVVDYRRVNARALRSTYYCRKASDVLAQCAGSIWFSLVGAVTGFNQIQNTRRAMEVLAIVARSGKFLPVCLTFGPVNGPGDFAMSPIVLSGRAVAGKTGTLVNGWPMSMISRSGPAGSLMGGFEPTRSTKNGRTAGHGRTAGSGGLGGLGSPSRSIRNKREARPQGFRPQPSQSSPAARGLGSPKGGAGPSWGLV